MKRCLSMLIIFALVLSACKGTFSTPIKKIIDNPRDFAEQNVTVSGEVKEVFGFFFMKYFVLNDGTAEIVVVTQRPLPRKGTKLRVKGKVHEMFALGETQTLVIVETNDEMPKPGN